MLKSLIVMAVIYTGQGDPLTTEQVVLERPAIGQVVCYKESFSWVFENGFGNVWYYCVDTKKHVVVDRLYKSEDFNGT